MVLVIRVLVSIIYLRLSGSTTETIIATVDPMINKQSNLTLKLVRSKYGNHH